MDGPVLIGPGQGEVIGDAPDRRVEILSDHPSLHATWSRFGPGRDGADLHIHRRHTDLFYVLAGELTLRLGTEGEEIPVPAGTVARVPPLVVHGFRNAAAAELRYLNLHAPGEGFADYMRALRDGRPPDFDQEDPPAEGVRPPGDAVVGGPVEIEAIAIAERREPPAPGADRTSLTSLYVLAGELTVTAGERELRAPAGSFLQIPPGLAHAITVIEPARWLELRTPAT